MTRGTARRTTTAGFGVAAVVLAASLLTTVAAQAATSWMLVASPNPGTTANTLSAVACPDATHCYAVGFQNSSGADQTLIEQWNGTSWSAVTSDNTNNINNGSTLQTNILRGIACTSTTNCWAVGYFVDSSNVDEALFDRWNGTSWTASTTAFGAPTVNYVLNGVSCVNAGNCWAVGLRNSTGNPAVVEAVQWNGSSWAADTTSDAGQLRGVSCVDTSHCWAVGQNGSSPTNTLIEAWNGTAWSAQTSPNQGTSTNQLFGVSCVSASDCWAAGQYLDTTGGRFQNLIAGFNGTSWTIPSGLSNTDNNTPAETSNNLQGVTCTSASNCWAVGTYFSVAAGQQQTLIDVFDGSAWTLVPNTPNNTIGTAKSNTLDGVACSDAGHCAAVGDLTNPDPTLVLMFTVAAPTPSSIPIPATGTPIGSVSDGGLPLGGPLIAAGALVLIGAAGFIRTKTRRRR